MFKYIALIRYFFLLVLGTNKLLDRLSVEKKGKTTQNMTIKKLLAAICLVAASHNLTAQSQVQQHFFNPQGDAKPWTFWYWMFGAASSEGITADLEAMKEVGLGGAYLMPIKGVSEGPQYDGRAQQLSPEWWKMINHSFKEADRLGLKMGMHICDGFALAGGPWNTPKESMQKVVWSDTVVAGGRLKNLLLPQPENYEGYYEDIATFAIPLNKQPQNTQLKPVVTYGTIENEKYAGKRTITREEDGRFRSSAPAWIQYEYAEPITARNIEIILSGNNYQAHRLKVLASQDGVNYTEVKQLVPARQGWQNTDFQSTHALPETTAKYFRFEWTPEGSEPGSEDLDAAKWSPNLRIKDIVLHASPRIHQWEGKAGLVWRVASATTQDEVADNECVQLDEIIELPVENGRVTAKLPRGEWRILRMGHTATGHTNATGGGAKGLECDKFSKQAVRKQLENWFGQMFENTDSGIAEKVLKYMHVDSWECGSQNWSGNFAAEFEARRGYSLMPYLPLLAGVPMENTQRSEQVLRDVRNTINELITDVFFTTLNEYAKEKDCLFSAECVSPTMVSDGMMHYQHVDLPMGEFWLNSPTHDKPNDMIDAIHGAHVYGKNIIQVEGFTQVRGVWNEDPAILKPLMDRNFALGVNKLFFHVYTHNPWLERTPGMTLDGIGLFFQRDQTWWGEGKSFVDYIARCQALLQYGRPVVDIAVFTGEEIPRRAILPDRLVPMLPGIMGTERVQSERIRLANEGEPTRVRPVGVTHSANMADPEEWINPLRGYSYDSFNKDALIRLAETRDGKIVLPGGAEYAVLVLPDAHPMNPDNLPLSAEVAAKIDEFRKAGVVIPQLPYVADDFLAYGIEKDVILPKNIAWNHRSGAEMELYFIADQSGSKANTAAEINALGGRKFTASFRIKGSQPELWNAQTGEITTPANWREVNGRTEVELNLPTNGSVFVVFPKNKREEMLPVEVVNIEKIPFNVKSWTVHFPLINETIKTDTLFDWSKSDNEKIKFYSGAVEYESTFDMKAIPDGRVYLQLGDIANVATVFVNGKECGVAWTSPYEVDVTNALKQGTNTLQVNVTNTWANALRGSDQGKAPFEGIWTNAKYRLPGNELIPAGWFGPYTLIRKY